MSERARRQFEGVDDEIRNWKPDGDAVISFPGGASFKPGVVQNVRTRKLTEKEKEEAEKQVDDVLKSMGICPGCHRRFKHDGKFCTNCGVER